jgi:hypothetical protein
MKKQTKTLSNESEVKVRALVPHTLRVVYLSFQRRLVTEDVTCDLKSLLMSLPAEVIAALPEIVAWVLDFLGETLKTSAPPRIQELYADGAKLSMPQGFLRRVLGAEQIAKKLVDQKAEFTKEGFSYLLVDDVHLLVTGTAVWQNSRHAFALVVELSTGEPSVRAIVANHIIHKF